MSYFRVSDTLGFYLQDAYVEDWINNTMLFLEVDDVTRYWKELQSLGLEQRFKNVKLTSIKEEDWGRECFMHDPSGELWHFGEFRKKVGLEKTVRMRLRLDELGWKGFLYMVIE